MVYKNMLMMCKALNVQKCLLHFFKLYGGGGVMFLNLGIISQ